MISRYEVSRLINDSLQKQIQHLHPHVHCLNLDLSLDLYASIHDLTAVAKKAVAVKDILLFRQCIVLAEKLFQEGEHLVKDVIENIFIYEVCSRVSKSLLPKSFYAIYLKQVMESN